MKQYVMLHVDVEAYYSGNTYYEELFLPLDFWEKVKDNVDMNIYISELDGKHSEVKAFIYEDIVSEKYLSSYIPKGNDGERLFYHIDENYLYEFENFSLWDIQAEVYSLSQVEEMTIKFKKVHKDTIMQRIGVYML